MTATIIRLADHRARRRPAPVDPALVMAASLLWWAGVLTWWAALAAGQQRRNP